MKFLSTLVILSIISLSLSVSILRTEAERKKYSTNKLKTTTKGDWKIQDKHEYQIYLYFTKSGAAINEKDYLTCKTKGQDIYKYQDVATDRKNGFYVTCTATNDDFKKTFTSTGQKDQYYVDYDSIGKVKGNASNSLWGAKGKTFRFNIKNSNGSWMLNVMFEYGYTGDYITASDLTLWTSNMNSLASLRQSATKSLINTAEDWKTKYETSINYIETLKKGPDTKAADDAIAKATNDKNEAQKKVDQADLDIAAATKEIEELEAQINAKKLARDETQLKLDNDNKDISIKTDEIADLQKAKTQGEAEKQTQITNAKAALETSRTGFENATKSLKTSLNNIVNYVKAVDDGIKSFKSKLYDAVKSNIDKIKIQT